MKTIRLLLAASVLASALSIPVFAGNMHTGIAPDPDETTETTQGEISTTSSGEIPNDGSDTSGDSAADVVGLVVDVLSSLF
jgi:hypothetical protein